MHPPLAVLELDLCVVPCSTSLHYRFPPLTNRGDSAPTFAITVEFFPCKAKLGDGSVQDIQRDTFVRWDVDCTDIDPQELQSMEEKAVKNLVERIGESIGWGPDQEVTLLRFDNWKGCYVRIEDGEEIGRAHV